VSIYVNKLEIGKKMISDNVKNHIVVTEFDAERLKTLILTARNPRSDVNVWLDRLQSLLENTVLVSPKEIAADVVTMNSKIKLYDRINKEKMNLTLVFPINVLRETKPDFEEFKVSILSPLGLSVFGRKVGDNIEERIIIARMLYQPKAAGNYDL
jgi:regulator of nucleoside diphosphate kinase